MAPVEDTEQHVQDGENEGDFELAGEEDFELYEGDSDHLGGRLQPDEPSKDAQSNQKVGGVRIRRSSIGAKIEKLAWEVYQGDAACRITLELSIRASTGFRIKDGDFLCSLVPLEGNEVPDFEAPEFPKILSHLPRAPKDDETEVVHRDVGTQIIENLELSPEVEAAGVSAKAGSWSRQKTSNPLTGYAFWSDPIYDTETIMWRVRNRNARDLELKHDFTAELVVAHGGKDFRAEFEIEARLDFGGTVLAVGKQKTVARHRNFRVLPSLAQID